ncbi:hypothetical protein ES711_04385 [Gelidibacter salicanalis]|uniref:Uncharacterized protein n=1 Tax=Gelidibacter salicanalis TaxID=291193 RepID=A0A5C7AKT7_9FLAO|nr:hypothetical protein [Gelidibacter salicanalis]TXE09178.1 hypothetical protein ES711_04385 [Gelidibacter salicanalis]
MRKFFMLMVLCNIGFLNAQQQVANPPGTIKLNDSVYIDAIPVSNLMFEEYLVVKMELDAKGYASFQKYAENTPDTEIIKKFPINYIIPNLTLLYQHSPALLKLGYDNNFRFSEHPVLNVPKILATDFCNWRTEMVAYLWQNNGFDSALAEMSDKISYRLATKTELIEAFDFFSESKSTVDFKRKLFKIKKDDIADKYTRFPIQEMTLSDEVYQDDSGYQYTGFRCVCEVKR